MTNIIGLADMRKKFRTTYDSNKDAAFLVHTSSKIIKFQETSEAIYALDMKHKNKYEDKKIKNNKKTDTVHLKTKQEKMTKSLQIENKYQP